MTNGQITNPGSGSYLIQIFLPNTLTSDFLAAKDYQWDLEVFDSGGDATRPIGGEIKLEERVRIAIGMLRFTFHSFCLRILSLPHFVQRTPLTRSTTRVDASTLRCGNSTYL